MTVELSGDALSIAGVILVGVVGYLSRTKADIIILKRDLNTAFRMIDNRMKVDPREK